jgi:transcriptional regulator with XRE-family HTH domain
MSMSKKNDPKFQMSYDRAMLRSAFLSLFWGIISERKKHGGFTFKEFAKKVGSSKHEVSRWFNGDPNWTINTVASIAHALDVELRIEAVDRANRVFNPSGLEPYGRSSVESQTETTGENRHVKLTRTLNSHESQPITSTAAAA